MHEDLGIPLPNEFLESERDRAEMDDDDDDDADDAKSITTVQLNRNNLDAWTVAIYRPPVILGAEQ